MAARQGIPTDLLLDRFTPEQFDEIEALDRIESDPDERMREIQVRGFIAGAMGKIEPSMIDPWREDASQQVTPRAFGAALRSAFS